MAKANELEEIFINISGSVFAYRANFVFFAKFYSFAHIPLHLLRLHLWLIQFSSYNFAFYHCGRNADSCRFPVL